MPPRRVFSIWLALAAATAILPAETNDGMALKQVDAKYVCMINKKVFPNAQIPVVVEGRTYYGCCDMCKTRLESDAKSRMDVDPVSGKEVDKATAVIGADKDGTTYFFESVVNLKKFKAPAQN